MSKRRYRKSIPPAARSAAVLVRLEASQVGMFRFLLEAWDNLAGFTVLDRREALLKVFFSPHQEQDVLRALCAMREVVAHEVLAWPSLSG